VNNGIYARFIKRLLDILCALLALLVFCWLYAIIAVLVRVKLGSPIIFSQYRPGKNERIFKLYKFRSMTNERDENGDLLPDAVRLTKFGRVLRALSLDELPEAWNILKGDMSVVGPRPWSIYDLKYYSDRERKRFSVSPGLSGWAQVNGRNNAEWNDRLRLDIEYAENISFGMDLKIVFLTVKKMVKRSDVVVRGEGRTGEFAVFRLLEEQTSTEKDVLPSEEIGGFFELREEASPLSDLTPAAWLPKGEDSTYTFSGRDAILMAIDDINKSRREPIRNVYIPSICSGTMVEPFLEKGIKIERYAIDADPEFTYSIDLNKNCDVFFALQYFGPRNGELDCAIRAFHERGIPVIEDITHSLLDNVPSSAFSDYCVASLRKWFGIPSGGYLMKRSGKLQIMPLLDSMSAVEGRIEVMRRKLDYLNGEPENKAELIELNQHYEAALIYQRGFKIDPISAGVLRNLHIEEIRVQRRRNAKILFELLQAVDEIEFAFSYQVLDEICPLFLPVFVNNGSRDELKTYLEHRGIYCSIHWPERMGVISCLNGRELSLVCDQRYGEEDMRREGNALCSFCKKEYAPVHNYKNA